MSPCQGCSEPSASESVQWVSLRVWYSGDRTFEVSCQPCWDKLPDDGMLGAIGYRNTGTTDYLSGSDWYGWIPFADGTWRLSGITGDRREMERVRARYPDSTWKEGILVSDAEMDRVHAAMQAATWPR